jgi:hypothetical protein
MTSTNDGGGPPPVTINDVLPGSASSGSVVRPEAAGIIHALEASTPQDFQSFPASVTQHRTSTANGINRGCLTQGRKLVSRARDVDLEDGLDLIHEENDVDFFEKQGVRRDTAKVFVRDRERWAKTHKAQITDAISVVS